VARLKKEKRKKSECVTGIVQGARPNVEAGRSLGTTGVNEHMNETHFHDFSNTFGISFFLKTFPSLEIQNILNSMTSPGFP